MLPSQRQVPRDLQTMPKNLRAKDHLCLGLQDPYYWGAIDSATATIRQSPVETSAREQLATCTNLNVNHDDTKHLKRYHLLD